MSQREFSALAFLLFFEAHSCSLTCGDVRWFTDTDTQRLMLRNWMIAGREGAGISGTGIGCQHDGKGNSPMLLLFECQHVRSNQLCFWDTPIRKFRSCIRGERERERDQSDGVSFPNPARSDTAALSDITAYQSVNLQECGSTHIVDMAYIAYPSQRLCGVKSWPPRSCRTTISRPSIVVYLSRAHSASHLRPSWDRYGSLDGDSHPANKAKNSHSTASSYGG